MAYADCLRWAGFDAASEEIITAGTVTTSYLTEAHGDDALLVVSETTLVERLIDAGLTVVDDETHADILVSIDRSFDYDRFAAALRARADDGVVIVDTDSDMVIPVAEGDIPGPGAMINAVAGVMD